MSLSSPKKRDKKLKTTCYINISNNKEITYIVQPSDKNKNKKKK